MLIPMEDGRWRWNDGPPCATRDEALKSAVKQAKVGDSVNTVVVMDCVELMCIDTSVEDPK